MIGSKATGAPGSSATPISPRRSSPLTRFTGNSPFRSRSSGVRPFRYWHEVTRSQSAIELRYGTPLVMGRRLAVEWWANLLNDGWPVTLAGEFLLTFADDGQCREVREYWPLALHVLRPPMSGVCRLWLRRGQA